MLAQNFMTPAELGIRDTEFEALVKVLGMLEREELKHAKPRPHTGHGLKITGHFNMAFHNTVTECGTVCCIAGTASLLMGHPGAFEHYRTQGLRDLCLPDRVSNWEKITPAQAALALRSYLTTGEPDWSEAMANC